MTPESSCGKNSAPVIQSVTLSAREVLLSCPPGFSSQAGACGESEGVIRVIVNAVDPDNDVLVYKGVVA
jgi:hypothetical protein